MDNRPVKTVEVKSELDDRALDAEVSKQAGVWLATVIVHRDPRASYILRIPGGAWVFPAAGEPRVALRELTLYALDAWMDADDVDEYSIKLEQADRPGRSTRWTIHIRPEAPEPEPVVWLAKGGAA